MQISNNDIAIIGMAGRFPEAESIDQFYDNLIKGKDSVGEISNERIKRTTLPIDRSYMICGYMEDIDLFDHQLFKISLGEAKTMDPHQRIMLEVVYETIENAGYNVDDFNGSQTAVYLADANLEYYKHADEYIPTLASGNTKAFLASRINQQFGLRGSAVMLDTTCSSSLVALHMACNELILGETDTALVGGVHLTLFPFKEKIEGLVDLNAADGKSKAFSSKADGMSVGEAASCILIKPLKKAIEDNDIIHAVIKASAINSNANLAASLTAPDSVAQAEVIKKAWQKANLKASDIGYIEAHGSGTKLGDSIEIGGLNKAFKFYTADKQLCPISTVKSNIGHTRTMAGLTGLIKAVLALKNKVLFPSVHFDEPHPLIDFQNSAVYVNRNLKTWERKGENPLIAGISSVGLSGTNCHVVIQESKWPDLPSSESVKHSEANQLFLFSGTSESGLSGTLNKILKFLEKNSDLNTDDLSYTLAVGRKYYLYRFACFAKNISELQQKIKDRLSKKHCVRNLESCKKIIFIFSQREPVPEIMITNFRKKYRIFDSFYTQVLTATTDLTDNQKCLLFQYAYYRLLLAFGIKPDGVVGVGIGKVLTKVINKEQTIHEALNDVIVPPIMEDNNIDQKVDDLVDKTTANDPVYFIEMGMAGTISDKLKTKADVNIRMSSHYISNNIENDPILSLYQDIFLSNIQVKQLRPNQFFHGKRMSLPAFFFTKSRCWIREEPKVIKEIDSIEINNADNPPFDFSDFRPIMVHVAKQIAPLWLKELNQTKIKKHDNFFENGGDSLKATKLINKINDQFKIKLAFEDIFDFQEFKQLVDLVVSQWKTIEIVKTIWGNVLKVVHVDDNDNFFDLGGHSLIANQVMIELRNIIGVELNFDNFFNHSTVSSQSAFVESLLKSRENEKIDTTDKIRSTEEQDHYQISHSQKRLWTIAQTEAGLLAYNQPGALVLKGELDIQLFVLAVEKVINRHESLRTNFVHVAGEPRQKITDYFDIHNYLQVVDLSNKDDKDTICRKLLYKDANVRFDLTKRPLFKSTLIKLKEKHFIYSFNLHHIITDGWSTGVIFSNVAQIYNNLQTGNAIPFTSLNIQYKDFTIWQNKLFRTPDIGKQQAFWANKFSGDLPYLNIPTDYPRGSEITFKGKRYNFKLDKNQAKKLKEFSRVNDGTLFMTLLAALNALIFRYTGQKDIVIGTPIAGRSRQDLQHQVGFFVNTLALRNVCSGSESFKQLISRIRNTTLEAYENQDYPFDKIITDIKLDWDKSRTPLFNVMLVLQNSGVDQTKLNGVTVGDYPNEVYSSHFDWVFHFYLINEEIIVNIDYNINLFSLERIIHFSDLFKNFIEATMQEPDRPIEDVNLISSDEQKELIEIVNDTNREFPKDLTVIHTFEQQVKLNPDRVALVYADNHITYSELNSKSNQLANYLRTELEIQPEDLIGLMVKATNWAIVIILGILKSGAGYVPIEENLPLDRTTVIVNDTGMKAAFVDNDFAYESDFKFLQLLSIDGVANKINNYAKENPAILNTVKDLIYVIYTSGSMGIPKGVILTHKNINRISINNYFVKFDADQRVLQAGSLSFDASTLEIWSTLLNGGCLYMVNKPKLLNVNYFKLVLKKYQITTIFLTVSWFNRVLDEDITTFRPLKYFLTGGEKISAEHAIKLKEQYPDLIVINGYGPTENCVFSTTYEITGKEDHNIPIGNPIANSTLYIFDQYDQLCPKTIIGEIMLGGDGIGRGYLNNPELTAEKFIKNPYDPNETLYRSGDLGLVSLNRKVYYMGRKDNQVKVRGFRIELEEIRHHILQFNGVKDAVVVTRKDTDNINEIVAYLLLKQSINFNLLNGFLKTRLTDYMIPTCYGTIDEIPLTPNGKLNLESIRNNKVERVNDSATFTAANDANERKLAYIFSKILDADKIGIKDNFFELGGHSLKATKLMAEIYVSFGINISLADIFENPTVETLSKIISFSKNQVSASIQSIEEQEYYAVSPALTRLLYLEKFGTTANITTAVHMQGVYLNNLEKAIKQVVSRHEILRTGFSEINNQLIQRIYSFEELELAAENMEIELVESKEGKVNELFEAEVTYQFNLSSPPLFRAKLAKIGNNNFVFVFTIHHAIADGWSLELMQKEILENYEALTNNNASPLLPLKVQFKEYVAWLASMNDSKKMVEAKAYWHLHFKNPPAPLELPLDFLRPFEKTFDGSFEEMVLTPALTSSLKAISQQCSASSYLLLTSILKLLLYKYTGQQDIVVGSPVATRPHKEFENQLGYYINIIPIRSNLTPDFNFKELLELIKNNFLDAHKYQMYSLDQLISDLKIKYDGNRFPLFDAVAVMQEPVKEVKSDINGLKISRYKHNNKTITIVDLRFVFQEVNDWLTIGIDFNTKLFKPETIRLMLNQFQTLCKIVVENPDTKISHIDFGDQSINDQHGNFETMISKDFNYNF